MGKVVHVDNSEFFRKVMKNFLREKGCETSSMSSGEEALREIRRGGISLVIMGLEFADMTGEQFVKRLLASSYSGPVVAVTSNDSASDRKLFTALGVLDYILKSESWQEKLIPYLNN